MKRIEKLANDNPELISEIIARNGCCQMVAEYYDLCNDVDRCSDCGDFLKSYLMEEYNDE